MCLRDWNRNVRQFSQILIEMFMVLANSAGMIVLVALRELRNCAIQFHHTNVVATKNSSDPVSVLRQHSCLKNASYDRVAQFCKANCLPAPCVPWERPPPEPERQPGVYTAQSLADWRRHLESSRVSSNVQLALENLAGYPPRAIYCATGVYPPDFDFTHHGLGGECPIFAQNLVACF